MKDLRTLAGKAKMDRELARRRKKEERARARVAELRSRFGTVEWQPIASCPFKDYELFDGCGERLFVTDGKEVALVLVSKRFGRPVKMVKEPEEVWTDDGLTFVGEFEEYDHPEWWFKYELNDVTDSSSDYRSEIGFIPTHWLPMLKLPAVSG